MLLRIVFLLFLSLSVPPATGQIPGISTKGSETPAAPKEETPEQTRERLEQWLKDARASLARFEEPQAEDLLPQGIPPAALADRRRDLDQTIRTLNRTLALLAQIPAARQEAKDARTATENWTGFAEKPPYSALKLDDLLNQQEAVRQKVETFRSSINIFTKSFDGIDSETAANEAAIRTAREASEPNANDAARWRADALAAKSRLLSVRAFFIRTNIELLEIQQAATETQLGLIERQISIVRPNAALSEADLAAVQKASDDRRAALRDEMTKVRQRLREASAAKVRAKTAADESNENPGAARDLAAARLAAAEASVESLDFIAGNLESVESLEEYIPEAYQNRKLLVSSKDPGEREAALKELQGILERLKAWEVVTANELSAVGADLARQDSNASVLPSDDARLPVLAELRKALWEKQDFLQRVSQTISVQKKNVSRWLDEFENSSRQKPWYSKVIQSGESVGGLFARLWNFEMTKVESVDYSAGVPRTETRVITLGIVLTALTLFLIAYLVSSRISRRVQGAIVGRGHLAEAQANTLRTWLMILVTAALALTTLRYFQIPLTVFAFFGGALAIGLGFGTQTLIKNFISGIIVLFERKIRVGDIVDIGGLAGSISEINTRSSVLRGPDGRETLVPNSVFLENSVTNLTLSNRSSRRAVMIGVAYGSPVSQVITILTECSERHGLIMKDPAPMVILQDFADNAILFKLYFWTAFDGKTNPEQVESDIRIMVQKRFDESGIDFPFPQRDLHLKSDTPLKVDISRPAKETDPPAKKAPLP